MERRFWVTLVPLIAFAAFGGMAAHAQGAATLLNVSYDPDPGALQGREPELRA